MHQMSRLKKICICAVCIALCYVLPVMFHATSLGGVLSPLHIPVLLCGIVCGSWFGAFCGIAGPILSSLLSGMPGPTSLITMIPELVAYGIVCGVIMHFVKTKKVILDLYIAMIIAMVAGRIVGGIAKIFFYLGKAEGYTFTLWMNSYFITAFPGIVLHLILIPILVLTLQRTGLIPARYPLSPAKETSYE